MDPSTPPESPIRENTYEKSEVNGPARITEVHIQHVQESTYQIKKSSQSLDIAAPKQLALPKSLLSSPNLNRVIKLLQSGNGVDKCIRTIQYTTRLLSHLMLIKGLRTPSTSTATQAIRRQFGLSRKLLRAFNNIGQINVAAKLLLSSSQRINSDPLGYTLEVTRAVGFTGFGLADTLTYLPDSGIYEIPHKGLVDKLAFNFWLYALVAGILSGVVNVYRLRQRITKYRSIFPIATGTISEKKVVNGSSQGLQVRQDLPPTPPESPIPTNQVLVEAAASSAVKELEMQQYDTSLNVLSDTADILFPLAALKVAGFDSFSDGVLGFAGCVSSVVGFRKAWKATA